MAANGIETRPPRAHYLDYRSGTPLTPPLRVKEAPPVSANELLGTRIDEQKLHKLPPHYSKQMDDFSLADKPIQFYQITGQDPEVIECIGFVLSGLQGQGFNQLLLAIAPDKGFGLDTNDCITDWRRVNDRNFEYTIPKHIKGLGLAWRILEREREDFAWLLDDWQSKREQETSQGFLPVIRWVNIKGSRKWRLNYLIDEPYKSMCRQVGVSLQNLCYSPDGMVHCNPTVGLYAAALFSPEVIEAWPQRDQYSPGGHDRGIGTTQVVAYAIDKSYQFLPGNFSQAAEEYIRTKAV